MLLSTRVFGAAYILSPLRIMYATESSGVHCVPGSEATRTIRQLPCFAKGASVYPVSTSSFLASLTGCSSSAALQH